MTRAFTTTDAGKRFLFSNPESKFDGRVGELEFPLTDLGSAEPGEGILWFGPAENRDGWNYVGPRDVEPI